MSFQGVLYKDSSGALKALEWYKSNATTATSLISTMNVGDIGYSIISDDSFTDCNPARDTTGVNAVFARRNTIINVYVFFPKGTKTEVYLKDYVLNWTLDKEA